jgi:hypothetical protein
MTSRFDRECWICDVQAGIAAFGGGSPQPAGNTTTTQTTNPWPGQQPYLTDFFQQAQNLYDGGQLNFNSQNAPKYYAGSNDPGPQNTVAQFTPQQTLALDAATNLSQNDPTANAATAASGAYLSGAMTGANPENAMLSPYTSGAMVGSNPENALLSPFLNGSLMSAGNPYFQQTANTTLASVVPGLEAQFNQGNSLNNPGVAYAVSQGAADALAPYAFSNYQQGLSNALAAAQQVGQNYNTGQGNQLAAIGQVGQNYNNDYANQIKALGLAPQTQALNFNDINQLYNAGAESQAQNQANLNAAIDQWNYGQQLPIQMLANYGNSIQGGYGSTSTVTQPYFQNQTANLLGGALGGGALGGMLGGPLGIGQNYGALGGAGLGALLAFV